MKAKSPKGNGPTAQGRLLFLAAIFPAVVLSYACLALLSIHLAEAQGRRMQLSDYPKIVGVSDPEISPNGKSIAFIVARANMDQNRRDRQLMLIDVASGGQRSLTYEREGVRSPRWSPTGDRIAFLAESGSEKERKPQIFVLRMDGGEAKKITSTPNGVEQFAWRPNGEEIAFVTADEPANKKEIEKHNDAFEVGDNDFLTTSAPTASHPRTSPRSSTPPAPQASPRA